MSIDECEICKKKAFMRCEEHNRCDKCGMTKEESKKNNISLVHRTEGLICDKCFKEMVDIRIREFDEDTDCTDEVVCPYCGYEHSDSWEYSMKHDGDETEIECNDCNKKFIANLNVEYSYSTSKTDCTDKGKKHKFKFRKNHFSRRDLKTEKGETIWIPLPEDKWEYNEIFKCEECDKEEYRKISREKYIEKYKDDYDYWYADFYGKYPEMLWPDSDKQEAEVKEGKKK